MGKKQKRRNYRACSAKPRRANLNIGALLEGDKKNNHRKKDQRKLFKKGDKVEGPSNRKEGTKQAIGPKRREWVQHTNVYKKNQSDVDTSSWQPREKKEVRKRTPLARYKRGKKEKGKRGAQREKKGN